MYKLLIKAQKMSSKCVGMQSKGRREVKRKNGLEEKEDQRNNSSLREHE